VETEDRSVDVPTVEVAETYRVDFADSVDAVDSEELDPIIQALKKERLALGWTQWDVARKMGFTSPARISQLESGEHDFQISTLRGWCEALGMEVMVRAPKSNRGRPRTNFK
jgi:predicted transcriptional regulator